MLKLLNASVNSRVTRYSNFSLSIISYVLNINGKLKVRRTFTVTTIKQWDQLPRVVREKRTVASFKHDMKLLFGEIYENIDHFII